MSEVIEYLLTLECVILSIESKMRPNPEIVLTKEWCVQLEVLVEQATHLLNIGRVKYSDNPKVVALLIKLDATILQRSTNMVAQVRRLIKT